MLATPTGTFITTFMLMGLAVVFILLVPPKYDPAIRLKQWLNPDD